MQLSSFSKHNKYIFTNHAYYKMRYYRLSEGLVKRVIRYPQRTEEGILKDAVACMRPAHSTSSVQAYSTSEPAGGGQALPAGRQAPQAHFTPQQYRGKPSLAQASNKRYSEIWTMYVLMPSKQIKIITAWRYPGKSPERNPVPQEIIEEARRILNI